MKFRCWMLVISAIVMASPVLGEDMMTVISQELAKTAQLEAKFVQTRQLSVLRNPLVIHGHMVFSRQKGVIWRIEQPYRVGYVMTAKDVREQLSDGSWKSRPVGNVPGIGSIEGLFQGILATDRQVLDHYFIAQIKGSAHSWSMTLTPKEPLLQKALKDIVLEGGSQVQNVHIEEVNGDDTRIHFLQIKPLKVLSTEDDALLN